MKLRFLFALAVLALAGCESLPIPTSETDPPPPGARADMSCMQDCLGDHGSPELCHARCAK